MPHKLIVFDKFGDYKVFRLKDRQPKEEVFLSKDRQPKEE